MSYAAVFQLTQPGPADPNVATTLSAQLRAWNGSAWSDSGAVVTTGFDDQSDANNRFFLWPLTIPAGFVGGVVFRNTTSGGTDVIGIATITPQELENADIRVSILATQEPGDSDGSPVGEIDWTIYRGTAFQADLVFSNDISAGGTHIWVTAKYRLDDPDSAKVFQKTESSGIVVTGALSARITLSAADTAALTDVRTKLYVDVKVQLPGQDPQEAAVGTAKVLQGATRAPGT